MSAPQPIQFNPAQGAPYIEVPNGQARLDPPANPAPASSPVAGGSSAAAASPFYCATPVILGRPDVPYATADGQFDPARAWSGSNYQGIQVSAVILNQNNQPVELRPLTAVFHAGEHFRLRLISTFDALASVDAYRAGGSTAMDFVLGASVWAGQLYPSRADQLVSLRAGEVTDLPLAGNQYFVLDGNSALERLVLNVQHPQARGAQANPQPVYRQDGPQGSSFVQLTPPGRYPALSQLIALQTQR